MKSSVIGVMGTELTKSQNRKAFFLTNSLHEVVRKNALRFCDLVGSVPITPITEDFIGQMFSIPIKCAEPEKFQRYLFEKYKIEIPVIRQEEKSFLRYSIQVFNSQKDLDVLYAALEDVLKTTDYIKR